MTEAKRTPLALIIAAAAIIGCIYVSMPVITAFVQSFTHGWQMAQKAKDPYADVYKGMSQDEIRKATWKDTCPRIMEKIEKIKKKDKISDSEKTLIEVSASCYDPKYQP